MPHRPTASDDALRADDVRAVWEGDPAWALLRSHNSRWIIPLFSAHLERAGSPVSADWFHERVGEALARQAADRAAAERAAAAGTGSDQRAAGDDPVDEPRIDPAAACRSWVDSGWLVRTRDAGPEGRVRYRCSSHALRALRIVRELATRDNAVSEARLGSITHAVHRLADLASPSAEQQLERLDEEIAALRRRREAIVAHGPEPVPAEAARRQLDEVVRLTSALPADFSRLSAMVEQRHREVARSASTEHLGKGELVDRFLRENDLLEQTPEGRAYRGFAAMLATSGIDALRRDLEQVLAAPFAQDELTEAERTRLETLIASLLDAEQEVQAGYGRWTASLRRFLSRSGAQRHHRLLALTERALHAGAEWAERRPGAASVPDDVLGIAPADVRDVTQFQPWRERGRPSIDVSDAVDGAALPDTERDALRLAAGTSDAAVESAVDRLLADLELVTGADVVAAVDPEFRRLGLVLSLLDLAIERDAVVDNAVEHVRVGGRRERDVSFPRVEFGRAGETAEPAGDDALDAAPAGATAPRPQGGTA